MALEPRGSSLWKTEFLHLEQNVHTCTWMYLPLCQPVSPVEGWGRWEHSIGWKVQSQDRRGWSADPRGADFRERLEEVPLLEGWGARGDKRGRGDFTKRDLPTPPLVKGPEQGQSNRGRWGLGVQQAGPCTR